MPNRLETRNQVACSTCAMNPLCRPRDARPTTSSPVECRRRLAPGEALYRAGERHAALFAVRAGFLKVTTADSAGGTHVVRFLLPGDVAGLDAFGSDVHPTGAESLDASEVCVLPKWHVEMLADIRPHMADHLRGLAGQELAQAQRHAADVARLTAPQRVARFLLELSGRWSARGFSLSAFALPMGRREIGEHLGLSMESVSRILSDFQARGWIALSRRAVELLRIDLLERMTEAAVIDNVAPRRSASTTCA